LINKFYVLIKPQLYESLLYKALKVNYNRVVPKRGQALQQVQSNTEFSNI
jgi:hypothetical protein